MSGDGWPELPGLRIQVVDLNAEGKALWGEARFREIRSAGGWSDEEIDRPDWRINLVIPVAGTDDYSEITMHRGATAKDVAEALADTVQRRAQEW